jgi:hypothetical protein
VQPRVPIAAVLVASLAGLGVAGCSGDDGSDSSASSSPTVPAIGSPGATAGSETDDPTRSSDEPPASPATATPTVPEVGVPGLDSDEVVCRAWSEFAGSFQVVAVAASFGEGAAALEVVAASTVVRAYDELLAAWPAELDAERDVVADDYLGPFASRAAVARRALVDAGASESTFERIESAWLAALAERDPASPDLAVDLDEATWALVDQAARAVEAGLPTIPDDPSLVTDAEVPLTEEYVADTCPDQGTLAGQELTD